MSCLVILSSPLSANSTVSLLFQNVIYLESYNGLLSLHNMHFRSLRVFSRLDSFVFSTETYSIIWALPQITRHLLKGISVAPTFGNYDRSCCARLWAGLCVDMGFPLSRGMIAGLCGESTFTFGRDQVHWVVLNSIPRSL